MRSTPTRFAFAVACLAAGLALAADPDAGRAKAASVCAACHGEAGASVSDTIPNLAAQKAGYLAAQLSALKAGTRKSDVMNPIASQLTVGEIENLAAYFASLPGVASGAKGMRWASLASRVTIPADYPAGFVRYRVEEDAGSGIVQRSMANRLAADAARAGKPLPAGSMIVVEVWKAKAGADGKPERDAAGALALDRILSYSTMASGAGWGDAVPAMIRNGDWHYAIFDAEKKAKPVYQAECLACHRPAEAKSYVFTLDALAAKR